MTAGKKGNFAKSYSEYFLETKFQPFQVKKSLEKLGFSTITPVAKLSWGNRNLEKNCSEYITKQSISFVFQNTLAFLNYPAWKLVGDHSDGEYVIVE